MEKKILVVDDEKMIRDMLEKAMNREGYSVVCAESGEEALEILKDKKIFVMFLDLKLPGMNGLELCRQDTRYKPHGHSICHNRLRITF